MEDSYGTLDVSMQSDDFNLLRSMEESRTPPPQSNRQRQHQNQSKPVHNFNRSSAAQEQESDLETDDSSSSSSSESEDPDNNLVSGAGGKAPRKQDSAATDNNTKIKTTRHAHYGGGEEGARGGGYFPSLLEEEPSNQWNDHSGGEQFIRAFMDIMQERFALVNQFCDTSLEPLTFNRPHKMLFDGGDLDYVVAYGTRGISHLNVPDHWHYVSFGISDTRGHGLEFPQRDRTRMEKSGFGFELTIRVQSSLNEPPPFWPVELLHSIARYIYTTNSMMVAGDHISWDAPLNGCNGCILQHMLITTDPVLPTLKTMTGSVAHYQIVGVTTEELKETQRWNTLALLQLFENQPRLGGSYLVTDIDRKLTLHEIVPGVTEQVTQGMIRDGSDLTGVSCRIIWTHSPWILLNPQKFWHLSEDERIKYAEFFEVSDLPIEGQIEELERLLSLTSFKQSNKDEDELSTRNDARSATKHDDQSGEDGETDDDVIILRKLHLTLSNDAALMIPTAFIGRVEHRRHFTFNDVLLKDAVTFVPNGMEGSFATDLRPFAARGQWIHVQLTKRCRSRIINDLQTFFDSKPTYPKFFSWPEAHFAMTIVDQHCF